jgi:phosphate uptake regulator
MPVGRKRSEEEAPTPGFTRRVQRTGASSLSVTLPKSWTDSMNLKIGTVLRFRDLGEGRLEISPAEVDTPSQRHQKLLKIDATEAPPNLLARLLIGGYITGQDQIVVSSRTGLSTEQLHEIRRTASHVIGMSIVDEDPERVEVQNFVDPGRFQLHRLLNQLVRMLRAELQACQSALADGDPAPLAPLGPLEDEIDRFYLLMVRQLLLSSDDFQVARDIGVESHHYQIGYRLVAKVLEVTGDLVSAVVRELVTSLASIRRLPPTALADLTALLSHLDEFLGRTMEAFTQLSVVDSNGVLNELHAALERGSELEESIVHKAANRPTAIAAQRIVSNLLMATEMLVIINEVTINRSVEPETVARTDRSVSMESRTGGDDEAPPRRA